MSFYSYFGYSPFYGSGILIDFFLVSTLYCRVNVYVSTLKVRLVCDTMARKVMYKRKRGKSHENLYDY